MKFVIEVPTDRFNELRVAFEEDEGCSVYDVDPAESVIQEAFYATGYGWEVDIRSDVKVKRLPDETDIDSMVEYMVEAHPNYNEDEHDR